MKNLYQLVAITLFLATSFLLASCLTLDADPEPAALDQAAYEETSMDFSQAEEAAFEAAAEEEPVQTEFDPTCDDACFPGACMACIRGCRADFDGPQEDDCLNVCSFCGHPCFC
jgi:hypothetical protein